MSSGEWFWGPTVEVPKKNPDIVSLCVQTNRPDRWDPETIGMGSESMCKQAGASSKFDLYCPMPGIP
jgi:hypothetical protein